PSIQRLLESKLCQNNRLMETRPVSRWYSLSERLEWPLRPSWCSELPTGIIGKATIPRCFRMLRKAGRGAENLETRHEPMGDLALALDSGVGSDAVCPRDRQGADGDKRRRRGIAAR